MCAFVDFETRLECYEFQKNILIVWNFCWFGHYIRQIEVVSTIAIIILRLRLMHQAELNSLIAADGLILECVNFVNCDF